MSYPELAAADRFRGDSTFDALVRDLTDFHGRMPKKAIHQAREHWHDFYPRLLDEMLLALQSAREGDDPGNIAFFGVALLAERGVGEIPESLPVLVDILSCPEQQLDLLVGDLLTEMLPQTLANAAHNQPVLLEGLVIDTRLYQFARVAAGNAMVHLIAEGHLPKDRVVGFYHDHLRTVLQEAEAGNIDPSDEWPMDLVHHLTDLLPHPAADDMLRTFDLDLIDEFVIAREDVMERIEQGEAGYESWMQWIRNRRVTDCIATLQHWFDDSPRKPRVSRRDELVTTSPGTAAGTVVRKQPKVGRNDPCPCGSGRKFKKCCGRS